MLIQTGPSVRTRQLWNRVNDRPIIETGEDLFRFNDAYMFNMLDHFLNHSRYSNVRARLEFVNRKEEIPMGKYVPPALLQAQWDHTRTLVHGEVGIQFLNTQVPYSTKLHDFLRGYHLPELEIALGKGNQLTGRTVNNHLITDFFAEIPFLRQQSHIYHIAYMMAHNISIEDVERLARKRNEEDLLRFNQHQIETGREVKEADFASRRPFSDEFHSEQIEFYNEHRPGHMTHSSNFWYVREYGLKVAASVGHVAFLASAGMAETDQELLLSHSQFVDEWTAFWSGKIPIAIVTDSFGTEFSYKGGGIRLDQVGKIDFMRPDSGDTIQVGEDTIDFIKRAGFDPIADRKGTLFGNGLDAETICKVESYFAGRQPMLFARGGDFGDKSKGLVPSQHTVFKIYEVNDRAVGKLPNESGKARFTDPYQEARYRRVFQR